MNNNDDDLPEIDLYKTAYVQIAKKQKLLFFSLLAMLFIILSHVFERPAYEYIGNVTSGEIKSIISREIIHVAILDKLKLYTRSEGYTVKPVSANYYYESIYHAIIDGVPYIEKDILEKANAEYSTSSLNQRLHSLFGSDKDVDLDLLLTSMRYFFGLDANREIKFRYFHKYNELKWRVRKSDIDIEGKDRDLVKRYAQMLEYFSHRPRDLDDNEYIYKNYILPRKLFCLLLEGDCVKWGARNFAMDYNYNKDIEVLKRIISNDENLRTHTSIILEDEKGYSIKGMPIKLKRNWIVYVFPIILGFFSIRITFYERMLFKFSEILKKSVKYKSREAILLIEGTTSSINAGISRFGRYSYLAVKSFWWLLIILLPIMFFLTPLFESFFSSFAQDPHAVNNYSTYVFFGFVLSGAYIALVLVFLFWKIFFYQSRYVNILNNIEVANRQTLRFKLYIKASLKKWFNKDASR